MLTSIVLSPIPLPCFNILILVISLVIFLAAFNCDDKTANAFNIILPPKQAPPQDQQIIINTQDEDEDPAKPRECLCDEDCKKPNSYCDFPLVMWNGSMQKPCGKPRRDGEKYKCTQKKPFRSCCFRDNECSLDRCSHFKCVECTRDKHCGRKEYCRHMHNPLIPNECVPKKHSGCCYRHEQCVGDCIWFRCR